MQIYDRVPGTEPDQIPTRPLDTLQEVVILSNVKKAASEILNGEMTINQEEFDTICRQLFTENIYLGEEAIVKKIINRVMGVEI